MITEVMLTDQAQPEKEQISLPLICFGKIRSCLPYNLVPGSKWLIFAVGWGIHWIDTLWTSDHRTCDPSPPLSWPPENTYQMAEKQKLIK